MNNRFDTIAALATAPGIAGIAVIRISGPDAVKIAMDLVGALPDEPHRAYLRAVHNRAGELLDHALVLVFCAPNSYTGEDIVEIQCHGGKITPRRVLEACFERGARLAQRGEFTERAFLNGKLDYDQAESILDLIHAKTDRAAASALAGLSGRKQRELKALYDFALEISSTLEHALDVSEAELSTSFYQTIEASLSAFHHRIDAEIRSRKESRLLRDGALVVLAGAPNAGKSTLLNALLGENRAIVSPTPGTTRDSIEAWVELGGFPIRLVDTAGLRSSEDAIESEGVRRSEELIARADIVLYLVSAETTTADPNLEAVRSIPSCLLVTSKCDLGRGEGLNVSVKTWEGLEILKSAIVARLETLEAPVDDAALSTLIELSASLSPTLYPYLPDENSRTPDLVLLANTFRAIAEKLGALIGATYSADLLDRLFSRFCIGK